MTCDLCPAEAVAFVPGTEEIRDLFLLRRGEPMRAFCLACWVKAFRTVEQRAREAAE